jgi:hypothetical protein
VLTQTVNERNPDPIQSRDKLNWKDLRYSPLISLWQDCGRNK